MLVCVMFIFTLAYPQTPSTQDNIDSVFGPPPTTTRRPNNRGAGVVVTPEPIVEPTQAPQTFINNGQQCLCVPYYMCDPTNQTVINDDVVDGFGVIDIRFDPQSCQDVLDVCCNADKQTEVPIVPVPIEQKPGRASGCGIRNVDGIDFQLAGNYVSDAFVKFNVFHTH